MRGQNGRSSAAVAPVQVVLRDFLCVFCVQVVPSEEGRAAAAADLLPLLSGLGLQNGFRIHIQSVESIEVFFLDVQDIISAKKSSQVIVKNETVKCEDYEKSFLFNPIQQIAWR